eukprot:RCo030289
METVGFRLLVSDPVEMVDSAARSEAFPLKAEYDMSAMPEITALLQQMGSVETVSEDVQLDAARLRDLLASNPANGVILGWLGGTTVVLNTLQRYIMHSGVVKRMLDLMEAMLAGQAAAKSFFGDLPGARILANVFCNYVHDSDITAAVMRLMGYLLAQGHPMCAQYLVRSDVLWVLDTLLRPTCQSRPELTAALPHLTQTLLHQGIEVGEEAAHAFDPRPDTGCLDIRVEEQSSVEHVVSVLSTQARNPNLTLTCFGILHQIAMKKGASWEWLMSLGAPSLVLNVMQIHSTDTDLTTLGLRILGSFAGDAEMRAVLGQCGSVEQVFQLLKDCPALTELCLWVLAGLVEENPTNQAVFHSIGGTELAVQRLSAKAERDRAVRYV